MILGSRIVRGTLLAILLCLVAAPAANAYIYWTVTDTDIRSGKFSSIARAELDGSHDDFFIKGLDGACGVAVDKSYLYWGGKGAVGRANIDGSGANLKFISNAGEDLDELACGVAVDDKHIYWAASAPRGDQWIGRANLDGSGATPKFIRVQGEEGSCGGLALDDKYIYWANSQAESIGRAGLDGSRVDQKFITGPNSNSGKGDSEDARSAGEDADDEGKGERRDPRDFREPCGVAVNGTNIYWANSSADDSTVGRAKIDGSGVRQAFIEGEALEPMCGLAINRSHLFWANLGTEAIGRARLDGTVVEPSFMKDELAACDVAVDKGTIGGVLDTAAPGLSAYRLGRKSFAAAGKGPTITRGKSKVGTAVNFTLSEAATVSFTVERVNGGRKVGGECQRPTKKNKRRTKCNLRVGGAFTAQGKPGKNSVTFQGRVAKKKLPVGKYLLVASASDPAGNASKARRAKFAIIKR